MSADAKTETALNGLKVLDLSRILAGPSATQI
jgi:crotonobetainyl-CoA:carnitine CoA-transferase CaiB-like acyl-CoA transferase